MPSFSREGLRLHYTELGDPDGRPVVLLHGLLWSSRMMERLASGVTASGAPPRVLLLDLRGHGRSGRPTDPAAYDWDEMADDVEALLDAVGVPSAVIGGLSLGANVALAFAHRHPRRCAGLVLEMPVLSRGHPMARATFGALALALRAGSPVLAPLTAAVRRLPLGPAPSDVYALRDVLGVRPRVGAAVLRGLLAAESVREDPESLAVVRVPALVIGHGRDPLHAADDARDLAAALPLGRLVEASSFFEHRLHPDRLAAAIRDFLRTIPRDEQRSA